MAKDDRHLKYPTCDSRFGDVFWIKEQHDKTNAELQKFLKKCEQQQKTTNSYKKATNNCKKTMKNFKKRSQNSVPPFVNAEKKQHVQDLLFKRSKIAFPK